MPTSRSARMLARISLAAILLFFLGSPAVAQMGSGKLTGMVRDATSGQPLAGAQVFIEGTGLGTLTQENGRYFILSVPPGTYVVGAQLIGYATVRKSNVLISSDVTRTIDFEMPSEAVALEEVVVEAQRVPLIETNATGSRDVVTADELQALPVADIQSALALQHGFLEVPQNTDVVSYLDTRRGISPVRIRGGRGGETLNMIDGIPVNNFMLGGASFYLSSLVVEQIDYIRGGFEAKYGNALSGVVNIKTREPRNEIHGAMEYQTSAVGSALGSDYDDLRDYSQMEGYVAGPVPGTGDKLRFVAAARNQEGADRVLAFDNDVHNPLRFETDELGRFGSVYDLVPGDRALGFDDITDVFGKLSYYFTPASKLAFTFADYRRRTQPYSFEWLQAGFDLYGQCADLYPNMLDVCRRTYLDGVTPEKMEDLRRTNQEQAWMLKSNINMTRRLYALNWDQTLGRVAYNIAAGQFNQERDTCIFLAGVCLHDRLASNWSNGAFQNTGGDKNFGAHPVFGSDDTFGGDQAESRFFRGDLEWQASDHHNISTGLFYQDHDIEFVEGRDVGLNNVQLQINRYAGQPWDAAAYIQDRIEYDFITVRVGFRFDYGRASGQFFANPQDPTNGTTAFEVCENPSSFNMDPSRFTFVDEQGNTVTGITACAKDSQLMNDAVVRAMEDDFKDAEPRRQFSPRLGISFPVTEGSSFFFNYGRFSQNPLLHNLYRQTAIGTPGEGNRDALNFVTNAVITPLVGNAHLLAESTTAYELGYLAEFAEDYALSTILYTKDQFGLTGIRPGGVDERGQIIFDAGSTYGSTTYEYNVLLNLDYQTARGMEISLRRRMADNWAFDLRYAFARVRTNAAPPELEAQKLEEEGDAAVRQEIRSEIDQPHTARAVLRFAAANEAPDIPFGGLLRNATLAITGSASSGLPFTPTLNSSGSDRLLRNSGTGPMRFTVDLMAQKRFRHQNLNYGTFLRVNNLFDRVNCMQVFTSTGRCDSGMITRSRLVTGGVSTTGSLSQNWDRADYLGSPRSISAGVTVSF